MDSKIEGWGMERDNNIQKLTFKKDKGALGIKSEVRFWVRIPAHKGQVYTGKNRQEMVK